MYLWSSIRMNAVRCSPCLPGVQALLRPDDEDKKDRYEEDGQQGAADHAAKHAGADGVLGLRAGATGEHQGHHPEGEGQRCHQNGAQAQAGSSNSSIKQRASFTVQLARKLHDEDGVLGRQTDDGDHAYFKEDVVGHTAQHYGRDGTEQAQRHHQHHRERDRPTLVECRQHQEDHQRRQQHQ